MLHIIVGYLQLLGDNVKTIFSSGHLLKRMSQALIQVEYCRFDMVDETFGNVRSKNEL